MVKPNFRLQKLIRKILLEEIQFNKHESVESLFFAETTLYEAFTKIVWDMFNDVDYFLEFFEVEEDDSELLKEEIRNWGFDPDAKCVLLDKLILKNEYKRKGHGTRIYKEFEQAVRSQSDAEYIVGQASELDNHHSLPFWTKMGFNHLEWTGDYPIIWKKL